MMESNTENDSDGWVPDYKVKMKRVVDCVKGRKPKKVNSWRDGEGKKKKEGCG